MSQRRVVITGIGLVTPVGIGVDETWSALLAGTSGAAPITLFDTEKHGTTFACEVKAWDPERFMERKLSKTLDRFVQFAVAAGDLAKEDAGLEWTEEEAERVGVFVGAGLGGVRTIEDTVVTLIERGPRRISPYFVPQIIVNLAPGQISIRYGCKGPNLSHVSACSTGAHSIGEAFYSIQRGDADVMFAGGTEATVSPLGVGGFNACKALSKRNDEPQRASRPFDADRDGFVMGEGAGILILEELDRAKKRGARIYAEVVGYGLSGDGFHITQVSPGGEGMQRCMKMALRHAGVTPDAVGYINAHGTSTKLNDETETAATRAVFGDHADKLAMSSTKSMTGHLLGAAGGIEVSFTALALARGVLPPTINYETPDPACDLDYVPNTPREVRVDYALSNSAGFGGTNATVLLKRFE
ncbi:MAG: beta-ketoacyl-ACP synthase II [Myxococcales bacterium]|nr:beta-ketoacyl-ACP synthase II [Myxococcales bacterium]